ncbi:hypothetical protein GGU11DRAFT_789865, partial [Lentinula aff. detonsa]
MLLISSLVSFNLFPRCRSFSASAQWLDYYRTLGVSPQASKAQIKSHFYQLSKKHHPDVSSDPKSKEIYAAVSAAYSVLSNDRERYTPSIQRFTKSLTLSFTPNSRAYDKKMQQEHRSSMSMSHYASNFHPSANHNGEWSRRHPGATHAWARRPHTPSPKHKQNPAGSASHSNFDSAHQAFRNSSHKSSRNNVNPSFIYANAATDGDKSIFRRKTEAVHRDREKIERISGSFRALQVLLVLVLISAVAAPRMGPGTVIITRTDYVPAKAQDGRPSDEELDPHPGSNSIDSTSLFNH